MHNNNKLRNNETQVVISCSLKILTKDFNKLHMKIDIALTMAFLTYDQITYKIVIGIAEKRQHKIHLFTFKDHS